MKAKLTNLAKTPGMGIRLPFGSFKSKHSLRLITATALAVLLWCKELSVLALPGGNWLKAGLCAAVLALGWGVLQRGLYSLFIQGRLLQDGLVGIAALMAFGVQVVATALGSWRMLTPTLQSECDSAPLFAVAAATIALRLVNTNLRQKRLENAGPPSSPTPLRIEPYPHCITFLTLSLSSALTLPVVWTHGGFPAALATLACLVTASSPESYWIVQEVLKRFAQRELPTESGDFDLGAIASIDKLVIEKTSVLTTGNCEITEVRAFDSNSTSEEILHLATIAEFAIPPHPLRTAILRRATEGFTVPTVKNYERFPGRGVSARYRGQELLFGNYEWFSERGWPEDDLHAIRETVDEHYQRGESVLYLSLSGTILGAICFQDPVRPRIGRFFRQLRALNLHVLVVSGDSPTTVEALVPELPGVDIRGGLHPRDRVTLLRNLQVDGARVATIAKPDTSTKKSTRSLVQVLFKVRKEGGVSVLTEPGAPGVPLSGELFGSIPHLFRLARHLCCSERASVSILTAYHLFLLPSIFTLAVYTLSLQWIALLAIFLGALVPNSVVPSWIQLRRATETDDGAGDSSQAASAKSSTASKPESQTSLSV